MAHWPFCIVLIGKPGSLTAALQAGFQQEGFAVELAAPGEPLPATALPATWLLIAASQQEADDLAAHLPAITQAPARVLVLSSYRVFSGEKSGFYHEADTPDGTDASAAPWQALEQWAGGFAGHCILRTDRLFAASADNILTRLLQGVIDAGEVHVTGHLRGCPTAESDIARVIIAMMQQMACGAQCSGVYHYCSGDITHCNEFAEAVLTHARQFQSIPDVNIITHEGEASKQRAPLLSCQRILDHFGIRQRAWHSSLPAVIREYFASRSGKPAARPH
ncbi:MAG TPA: sugar nucleotide-binding protein [Pseudomonadales bacterium]|jgi:dTDP-4-dehydrorhamnose reductase